LDHRVVEFAYSLPEELVKSPNESKILRKKLLRKYVPNDLTQRPKKGFGVPLAEWLRGPLREWMLDHLNPRTLQSQGFLNPDIVAQCVESHLSEARDSSAYLWDVLMFQVWLARTGEYRRESKVQLGTGRTDASATVISAV
jgi:asparagine synthase (glutamine-hydrolysing)